jgi:hypothetical protein
LTNGKLQTKNVEKESTILEFMSPTDAPIVLRNDDKQLPKEDVVETSDIAPILGEFNDPIKTDKKPGPWDPGYKHEWPPAEK